MSSVVSIFDWRGHALAELDVDVTRRWKLNNYGKGHFDIALTDKNCTNQNLQLGNLVYVTHNSLPPWCGVLDTPRQWHNGYITCTVYSVEYWATFRYTTGITLRCEGTPGAIYQRIVENSDLEDDPLEIGEIYEGGPVKSIIYNWECLYDIVNDLADENFMEWGFIPYITENNNLAVQADWYQKRGRWVNQKLIEGKNMKLENDPFTEQGTIANRLQGFGQGSSWAVRPKWVVKDTSSISYFGKRMLALELSGVTTNQVADSLRKMIYEHSYPRKTLKITALDVDSLYSNLNIGNSIDVEIYSVGFNDSGSYGLEAEVRILEMEYSDLKGELSLVCDVAKPEVDTTDENQ